MHMFLVKLTVYNLSPFCLKLTLINYLISLAIFFHALNESSINLVLVIRDVQRNINCLMHHIESIKNCLQVLIY